MYPTGSDILSSISDSDWSGKGKRSVSAGPLTPDKRRELTRRHLLDAAAGEFARQGFHGASLDAVAAAAGFTKGAVYSNFSSKADLFLAVIDDRMERQAETLNEEIATPPCRRRPTWPTCRRTDLGADPGRGVDHPRGWSSCSTPPGTPRPGPSWRHPQPAAGRRSRR